MTNTPSLPRLPAKRALILTLWISFVGYATFLAPPDRGTTFGLIMDAIFLRTDRLDAAVIAVFNLLGVVPALYASVLLAEGRGRKLPAWPFVLGSCFLGAFALLPYLAFREDDGRFLGERTGIVRLFDSRGMGVALLLMTLGLVVLGLTQGQLLRYADLFHVEPLVHIMTLDFLVLSTVFGSVLGADMERRGLRKPALFWLIACVPLLGPAVYVALRPALPMSSK